MYSVKLQNVLKILLPLVIFSFVFTVVVYWGIQQNYRSLANDPQIQLSEDTSSLLANGGSINFAKGNKIEMSKSLAPFMMIFDSNKKLITSSGMLYGKDANVPSGVFDFAKLNGQNKFSWQPTDGVRNAAVLTYYKNGNKEGYVLSARSLRETEKREKILSFGIFAGWLIAVTLSALAAFIIS